jgi:hypothetical protein
MTRASANNLDTIYVNKNVSASLEFDTDINYFLIAGNQQTGTTQTGTPVFKYYDAYLEKNTITFMVKSYDAPMLAVTIKLVNGDMYVGFIKVNDHANKLLYSYKKKSRLTGEKEDFQDHFQGDKKSDYRDELTEDQELKLHLKERVGIVIGKGIKYNTWGVEKNKMQFQIANMMNDSKYTYLFIIIANQSGQQFDVDGVVFKYEEGKRKKVKKNEAKVTQRIVTVIEPELKNVPAYTTVQLGYVIPLFSVNDRGSLIIQFVEKEGIRDYTINIKARETRKVDVFKDVDLN